jgi:hypothetical protein
MWSVFWTLMLVFLIATKEGREALKEIWEMIGCFIQAIFIFICLFFLII